MKPIRLIRGIGLFGLAIVLSVSAFAQDRECDTITFTGFAHGDTIGSLSLFGGDITLVFSADRFPGNAVPVTAYDTELWSLPGNPPPNDTHYDTQRAILCNPANNGGQGECMGIMAVIPDENFAIGGDDTEGGTITITGFTGDFEITNYDAVDTDDPSKRIILRVGPTLDFVGESSGLGNATVETVDTLPHTFSGQAQFEFLGSGGIDNIEICRDTPPASNCRVTAGGNRDGVFCPVLPNGDPDPDFCEEDQTSDDITHTWGGQAGAPPRVDGNWTHKYLDRLARPHNKFTFHSNEVVFIQCSDPGFCDPARPAPARQIDFTGIGSFTNTSGVFRDAPDGDLCYMVHLEDIGEPGPGGQLPDPPGPCTHCPGTAIEDEDCTNCTDYYEIEIYANATYDASNGQCLGQLIWRNGDPSMTCDGGDVFVAPNAPYEGFFTRTGNVQLHPDNNGP
ncbi:MAG TPA: hypothetical protein VD788_02880 [Candidatus Polarisedimenticolaceae bacterium]|nr:hypothetical protein [Candidatus Polarisedimenticolaceae bacterium]